ncbi:carcinine hydrolase/isopenicillin-N N-acyltransferase family protein [Formivibrio citricus]|nr:carcinine hydrolase/isopenicillin-N N-acyltransferase family protein [Formivibrio citricus]
MRPPFFALSATLVLLLSIPAQACTLWAAAGPDAGGGTLLSKNRDWAPDHVQILKYERPFGGHVFFGLYAEGNNDPGIKNGINEKGLSIVSASASSIPKKMRAHQPGKRGVIRTILSRYASVDELAADADRVFSGARANFYLVSDRSKVLLAEVGLDGKFSYRVVDKGVQTHTNHYLDPKLAEFNVSIGQSSSTRQARINELLTQSPRPFTTEKFAAISRDRNDGPDNSLWRNGKQHTVASWIVHSPASGPQKLRVVLANPDQPEALHEYTLDEAFWKKN